MPWQHSIIIIISHAFLHVLHSSSTTSVYHYHRHHHHHQYHHQQLFFLFLFIIFYTAHSLIHYPLDHIVLPLVVELLLLFFRYIYDMIQYDNFQSNFLPQHGSKSCHYPLHILTCTVLMAIFPGKWLSIGFHIPINTLRQPSTSYNIWTNHHQFDAQHVQTILVRPC